MVDFVEGCIDEGAPEILVNGLARIQRISPNLLRVTYFRKRDGEVLATVHVIWDRQEWLAMCKLWDNVSLTVSREAFEAEQHLSRSKETH
jgi:hypothetical protein